MLKLLPSFLAAIICLSGCGYDEYVTYYEKPHPVFHGKSYPPLEMVVVERRPIRNYWRPRVYTYYDKERTYLYRKSPYASYNPDTHVGESAGGPQPAPSEDQR